jgi:hypothetical protein
MDNVTVVAVGTNAAMAGGAVLGPEQEESDYASITILVPAADVERMLLANELVQEQGTSIYCILRSELETSGEAAPARVVSDDDLLQSLGRPRR